MQSTIRAAELESIKRRALIGKMVLGSEDDDSSRQAERHERSQQRAAKWPNTLQATRKKKEDARKERLAREEAARVEIDKQEERRRNRKRLEAIKRANQALLSQTDKMKMLKSQKMMSDVNEVNDSQILIRMLLILRLGSKSSDPSTAAQAQSNTRAGRALAL